MLIHYVFHIWFKVVRQARKQFHLSVNCLLVLNAAYIYSRVYNKTFTRTKLLKFASYYNNHKIGTYITVLVSHDYIVESGKYKNHQLYVISELGIKVMELVNKDYEIKLREFLEGNNIEL